MTMRHIEDHLAKIEDEADRGIALAESARELAGAAKAKAESAKARVGDAAQSLRRIKGEVGNLREMVKESV